MRRVEFDKNAAFESERLRFRGITSDDAENLVRGRSRKDVYEVSGQTRPVTMTEHLAWFDTYMRDPQKLRVIITDTHSSRDIGMVGGVFEDTSFVLSYYIGEPEYRGLGLASEAIAAFMKFVSESYDVRVFEAHINPDNAASIGCVRKLGFVEIDQNCESIIYGRSRNT